MIVLACVIVLVAISCALRYFLTPSSPRPEVVSASRPWTSAPLSRQRAIERTPLLRAAAHESGHAIVALRCSHVVRVEHASIFYERAGAVEAAFAPAPLFEAAYDACLLVFALGGVAGETQAFGRFRGHGTESDFFDAMVRAERIVKKHGYFAFTPSKRRGLPFEKVYASPPSPEVLAVISDAYDVARDIIEHHHVAHSKLTGTLIHRRRVEEKELHALFGERGLFHKFASLGAPRFL